MDHIKEMHEYCIAEEGDTATAVLFGGLMAAYAAGALWMRRQDRKNNNDPVIRRWKHNKEIWEKTGNAKRAVKLQAKIDKREAQNAAMREKDTAKERAKKEEKERSIMIDGTSLYEWLEIFHKLEAKYVPDICRLHAKSMEAVDADLKKLRSDKRYEKFPKCWVPNKSTPRDLGLMVDYNQYNPEYVKYNLRYISFGSMIYSWTIEEYSDEFGDVEDYSYMADDIDKATFNKQVEKAIIDYVKKVNTIVEKHAEKFAKDIKALGFPGTYTIDAEHMSEEFLYHDVSIDFDYDARKVSLD